MRVRFPREFVFTLGRVLRAHWGEILLIQLVSGILQTLAHSLAVEAGRTDAVRGLLWTGLGTLFAVAGLVAICVICHDALRSTDELPERGRQRRMRIAAIFSASILPFFLTYVAWGLFQADVQRYARGALNSLNFAQGEGGGGSIIDVGVTTVTVTIIVGAFLGRIVVRRWMPEWGGARTLLMLLLEAVWAFLAAMLIGNVITDLVERWEGTNLNVWFQGVLETNAVTQALGSVLDAGLDVLYVVSVPLLWVALAGITVMQGGVEESRLSGGMRAVIDRLPPVIDDLVASFVVDLENRWLPVVGALTTMVRAGAIAVAGAIAAGILTTFAGGWFTALLAHLPGPGAEPFTRQAGEALISLGTQLTFAATITIALVTFDTLRVINSSREVDAQPRRSLEAYLEEK